jgi:hypothetical protein
LHVDVSSLFLGCLLYADDFILVFPSISGLQAVLDKCTYVANIFSLQFNINQRHCIAIGKMNNIGKTPMILCGSSVVWRNTFKYLGIYLLAGKVLKFDITPCRRSLTLFLRMHGSVHGVYELVLLTLHESFGLPV